jgi:hypothetical protein
MHFCRYRRLDDRSFLTSGNAEYIDMLWRASEAVRRWALINQGFDAIFQTTKM